MDIKTVLQRICLELKQVLTKYTTFEQIVSTHIMLKFIKYNIIKPNTLNRNAFNNNYLSISNSTILYKV